MKKILLLLMIVTLIGCVEVEDNTEDVAVLIKTVVEEQNLYEGDNTTPEMTIITSSSYNDHGDIIQSETTESGDYVYTTHYEYDLQNKLVTTLFKDDTSESKHVNTYEDDRLIKTVSYDGDVLYQVVDYIYDSKDNYEKKTTNGQGNLIRTTVYSRYSDGEGQEIIIDVTNDFVTLIRKIYNNDNLLVEEFISYNDFYSEKRAYTYDNHSNQTDLKKFRIVNGEKQLDEVVMTEYKYDDFGSIVYERMTFRDRFSLETKRTFTYDE